MDDYENRLIDPHRHDFLPVDHTQDWIKAATVYAKIEVYHPTAKR